MNTNRMDYESPEAKTRHDSVATSVVLVTMLVSALSGAFLIEADPAAMHAADTPARYAAAEEARP